MTRISRVRSTCPRLMLAWFVAIAITISLASTRAEAETPVSIDMKLLVISADGSEPVFAGIKSILDQIGVPYDAMIATQTPLTQAQLSNGAGGGRYQGILLTTGNLAYYDSSTGQYESALTAAQWEMLYSYQRDFRVRQATLYTFPGGYPDNYGLQSPQAVDTTSNPVQATLTAAGQSVFSYLNSSNPITISNAYTYLATPDGTGNLTPLVMAGDYPVVSVRGYPDGRQNLTITTDGNPELVHTLQLGYGVVNWVTKGFFLGSRKIYLTAQPDDIMIADNVWDMQASPPSDETGLEYRMTGDDYRRAVTWQNDLRNANANNRAIRLEMPFNGVGASGIYTNDTLTRAVRDNPNAFGWINHTYEHELLDAISQADAFAQLDKNHKVAGQLKFKNYFKDSMIQPEISGLNNPSFLAAARQFGIRYILSDTSQPGWKSERANTGFYSTYEPSILIIPRYPTNLYYNVTTPDEWMSEYNHFYAPGGLFPTWDHPLAYEEVLDKESEIWLRYLLKFHINPVMFHQSNLRAYDGRNSLLGDLIAVTLNKFNRLYSLPIASPPQHDIGIAMANRMAYNSSGISGKLVLSSGGNTITLSTRQAVKAPLTGIAFGGTRETYGGQVISTVPLNANGTVSKIPAPVW